LSQLAAGRAKLLLDACREDQWRRQWGCDAWCVSILTITAGFSMAAMLFKLPPHGMISRAFLVYSTTTVADTIMNIAATQKQIVIGDSHRLSANTCVRYMANLDPALQNLIRIREPFQFKGFTNRYPASPAARFSSQMIWKPLLLMS